MEIWNIPIIADVEDIIRFLKSELQTQQIDLLKDIKPSGQNLMVTCINHADGNERKPSCGISTIDVTRQGKFYPAGTVHCFTCDYTSELPEFVSHCFGYNDKGMFGFKWLTSNFVNLSIEKRRLIELDMTRGGTTKKAIEFISESELESYRFIHPYMYRRRLNDAVIDYFDIGFDAATNALTFPVCDKNGNVMFIQRRSVDGKKFINDVTTMKGQSLFGLYQIYRNLNRVNEIIICESPIDALTCWVRKRPAVATMQAIPTFHQIKLLDELPVRKFISGLDNDDAGRTGEKRLKETLGKHKLLYDIQFPKIYDDDLGDWRYAKDINEMPDEEIDELRVNLL